VTGAGLGVGSSRDGQGERDGEDRGADHGWCLLSL
jgi:hypothetical protein